MASWGDIWSGVKKVAGAVDAVMNFGGTPGGQPAPSLVGQKPELSFGKYKMGFKEGAGLMAGTGRVGIDVPSRYDSKNQWINLQANYLSYLNMAEAFEEPGKVRRAIKLKVS